jgi:hypothetical protein
MNNMLKGLLNNVVVSKISESLGTDSGKTKSAMNSILPALLGGLASNSAKKEQADLLGKVLAKDHDGSILDNLSGFLKDPKAGKGGKIVGHILGNKSETLAKIVMEKTGLSKEKSS